ncbi:MAG: DNA repair protein RecN [Clostridia bacterium]|nr:DNA repair protein RecN [Clostridia bacterium]
MLLEMNIRNIALIDRLRIEFQEGLNVLTGETGAGKSIVIDSVNLALGGRADRDLIRSGADKASVQAVFDVRGHERVLSQLNEWGYETDDGLLAVSREMSASGRNLCRIAGEVATLSQLRQLTGLLVELHGQHEHQELMSPARHLAILDAFGGEDHQNLLKTVQSAYGRYASDRREYEKLQEALRDKAITKAVLERQLGEILSLKIKPGEDKTLEQRFKLMENAEKIQTRVERAFSLVYEGSDRAPSVQEALKKASNAMQAISDIDSRYEAMAEKLQDMYYAAQDAGYELQDMLEGLEFDPATYDKVGSRLDAIERLKDLYGPTLDDVLRFRDVTQARLDELEGGDERLQDLRQSLQQSREELKRACGALTASRKALAGTFEESVISQLRDLGMEKVRFTVRFASLNEEKMTAYGADAVEFLISPNPGEPLKPLSATASGGELSRVMLAIKTVMAQKDGVGTIIFDEIDTGVSGRMAQAVGEKMCAIGAHRQVIAVSHLPQIAALGDAHFAVEKNVENGRTLTTVRLLDDDGRVRELSRLVGGAGDPQSSINHAKSLLSGGQAFRRKRSTATE